MSLDEDPVETLFRTTVMMEHEDDIEHCPNIQLTTALGKKIRNMFEMIINFFCWITFDSCKQRDY